MYYKNLDLILLLIGALLLLSVWPVTFVQAQTGGANCQTPINTLPVASGPAPVPSLAQPARGGTTTDPVHQTCIMRLVDHRAEGYNPYARINYSRSQAFNADSSRVLISVPNGSWHLADPDTGRLIGQVPGLVGDAEPQWHRSNPDLLYFLPAFGGLEVRQVNVATGAVSVVGDFSGRLPWSNAARVWTRAEGSPSADQRYWGFLVETQDFHPLGLMVWDERLDTVIATLDFQGQQLGRPDHVSMSPSGESIVSSWGPPVGTVAYSRDFSQQVQLHTTTEHSDLAILANGRDAYVSIDFQSNAGDVFYVDIAGALQRGTADRVVLFPTFIDGMSVSMHISGKAFQRPGWVLISTYDTKHNVSPSQIRPLWMQDRVFAVELTSDPRILGVAHPRARVDGEYFEEPHATVNQDFTQIAFNSNWGRGGALDVDAYLVKTLQWGSSPPPPDDGCDETASGLQRTVQHGTWVLMSLPCEPPPGLGVAALFGDDVPGVLGEDWAVFTFDASNNLYQVATAATELIPGQGFWFTQNSGQSQTLDLPGGSRATPASEQGPRCGSPRGCQTIGLAAVDGGSRWHITGDPFAAPLALGGIRVSADEGECSDSDGCDLAEASGSGGGELLESQVFAFDDGAQPPQYRLVGAVDSIAPWSGVWMATRAMAEGNEPVLHLPIP